MKDHLDYLPNWTERRIADYTLVLLRTVEEACQRSLNHFPCPGLAFPMPALDFDFRIAVRLNQEAVHVDSGNTKEITTVKAGVWSGSFGHGRVIVRFPFLLHAPQPLLEFCAFIQFVAD